ncbi:TRAP transporter large permease subunit [Erysipelothrix sp. HDW6C]|uniref:CitMHS family transporter n=1 Tax=Erysipelothrix sp. HDW6C TaxID=2714930 RepID=UPI00140E4966|nr:citrate:proton symporter [Erysipelothrix sp. HDW6C]QIK69589.1 TRAP transporter large permease subunit [Erysipelothrix sp. HDW6C]
MSLALTILAWGMIAVFLVLIMKKKLSPFTALIIVPLVFALIGSFMGLYTDQIIELKEIANPTFMDQIWILGDFVLAGIKKTSTTGIMLLFAIFYFAIMLDAGMFDPITRVMIKFANGDPLKVLVATAVVAASVSLNGDGTTTTLITCTAFIPLYKKLGMKMMNLGVIVILMNTIMNLLPWGGPTARVISVLPELNGMDSQIMQALMPGMILATLYMLGVSVYLGLKERKRIGIKVLSEKELLELTSTTDEKELANKRPKLFVPNLILTITLIAMLMIEGTFPSVFLFLVGTVIALLMNYPKLKDQKARLHENSGDAVAVVILVLGAGVFTGLFTSTGMSDALAHSLTQIIPTSFGKFWGLVVAFLSAPGTFFLSNDAFYYGVLPVLTDAGATYGWTQMELGIASLLGQAFHLLSPLVAFIYLLLQMTELEMGEWQKESAKWAIGIFVIFVVVAGVTGAVPFFK